MSAPLLPQPGAQTATLLDLWDRMGIGVRCAYNPGCPCAVRRYLEIGRRLVSSGARSELQVQQRMLQVLLQVAHDPALPWLWRSICLEHTAFPRARLVSLLAHWDPLAVPAMDAALQAAHDILGLAQAQGRSTVRSPGASGHA
ncbi:MAG: hypothetical protein KBC73_25660 [Burkholderiaceae bacterium]|nr:hypothetical protein [Burkholderiaceae bacterium]